ncbi:MAG: DNA methyltransferase [Pseudomonadota bacterium]
MNETLENDIRDLRVDMAPVTSLKPYARNARTHSKQQIHQIAKSIRQFGWTNPILVDEAGGVMAGHGRLEAATQLGMQEVPIVRITNLTSEQKRAYILADNKLAEKAGWDADLLRIELTDLASLDLDFAIEDLGFETAEIDLLLSEDSGKAKTETAPEPQAGPTVSCVGDIWKLGRHRLICGDALDPGAYADLLEGQQVDAVFTDPPYNVPISGHVCGSGAIQHDEFVMASGEMSAAEFRTFLQTVCVRLREVTKSGAVSYFCMDWRHIEELIEAGKASLGDLINLCVWNKNVGGMGSLYRSKHELVAVFKTPGATHRNNVALGKHGRNRTNVWDYPSVVTRKADLKLHPTVKPIAMVADAIKDVTRRGDLVLDPFAGSGTTLLAAEQTGRTAACIELDPRYVDVIIRRFQDETGQTATLAGSDTPFDALA